MTKLVRLLMVGLGCTTFLFARSSAAQMGGMGMPGGGMGGPTMGGGMGGSSKAAPKPNPKEPVTHAASGASDEAMRLGGSEPTLPEHPLEISPELRKQIGTDAERDRVVLPDLPTKRLVIPPYYAEKSGDYSFKTVFPVWAERKLPADRASLFGLLYFNRRSPKHDADVVFPLFWNLRDEQTRTTVVGPFVHREAPREHDNWLAPLVFSGVSPGSGYLHMPPLLTFTHYNPKGGFNLIGPFYCSWNGPSGCHPSRAEDIDYGLPPLFFAGKSDRSRYEFVPSLLHYYRYDEVNDSSVNVWGPLVWTHTQDTDAFNVLPFVWHNWGKNKDNFTLFPLFHYGYEGNRNLLINPLFVSARGENGESTFATWGYARYRGRTKFDMITPFYWHTEDPDIGASMTLVPPFVYTNTSPRGRELGIFPFYYHSQRYGLSDTTWITPVVRVSHDLTGWATNIHPFVFLGRTYESTHTVIAPFFWDFASPHSRTTVVFPALWRFADDNTVSQLVLNTYYRERRTSAGKDWEFHFFPAFSYGETPDGHWWNVLYGLAGYTRRGDMAKVRAFWIPITVSGSDP